MTIDAGNGPTAYENNLAWAEHLPEGWSAIYRDAVGAIHGIDAAIAVTQAKQKFGELRIHLEPYDMRAEAIIDTAERQSKLTCEECGQPGQLMKTGDGYYSTRCALDSGGFELPAGSPMISLKTSRKRTESIDLLGLGDPGDEL